MEMWWNAMSMASHVFLLVAIPATVVLIVQTVLMLIGIGDAEVDAPDSVIPDDMVPDDMIPDDGIGDLDGDGADFEVSESLHIFSIRGVIAFLVVFGWLGLAMDSAGVSLWITLPVAVAAGAAIMVLLAFLLRAVMRLRGTGNLDIRNALGTAGTVYLTVPEQRKGTGKVSILLQGSLVEREAVTDDETAITTGTEIVVVGVSGQTTLVVRRK